MDNISFDLTKMLYNETN